MPDEKTEYFIEQTNARLKSIDDKLDSLLAFRAQLLGLSIAVTVLIDLCFVLYQGGK